MALKICKNCKKETTNKFDYCDDCKKLPRKCIVCGNIFYLKKYLNKRYCSKTCSSIDNCRNYRINDNFFTDIKNIKTTYEILGLIFACGVSTKRYTNALIITSSEKNLRRLVYALKTDYPVIETMGYKKTGLCQLTIFSRIIVEYLKNIGISANINKHDFPSISEENKIHFIRGFVNTERGSITEFSDYDLISITSSNKNMIQNIHNYTGGEILLANLNYNLIFQDKTRKYRIKK